MATVALNDPKTRFSVTLTPSANFERSYDLEMTLKVTHGQCICNMVVILWRSLVHLPVKMYICVTKWTKIMTCIQILMCYRQNDLENDLQGQSYHVH